MKTNLDIMIEKEEKGEKITW